MYIKGINEEDFTNYKKTSMFIIFPFCDFKCDRDSNTKVCQNWSLSKIAPINVDASLIVQHYINNPITHAIVMGGLEPMESFEDLVKLIEEFRKHTDDDIVIFTGFYEDEISDKIRILSRFSNIIVKFGRYFPNSEPLFDDILGIKLASKNQYAKKIS